ncbi:hypothetical protein [Pacificibacter marinus]|uniref:hypothetical protein n=1 Tax=Pacificibacter marinus TaxID=658057 RepID=UPI001C07412E|nr:hypothetical protein [Pacificibacter marinus]MBU2866054.1 hypothetical protein [Pacificibacter marinus]
MALVEHIDTPQKPRHINKKFTVAPRGKVYVFGEPKLEIRRFSNHVQIVSFEKVAAQARRPIETRQTTQVPLWLPALFAALGTAAFSVSIVYLMVFVTAMSGGITVQDLGSLITIMTLTLISGAFWKIALQIREKCAVTRMKKIAELA